MGFGFLVVSNNDVGAGPYSHNIALLQGCFCGSWFPGIVDLKPGFSVSITGSISKTALFVL